MMGWGHSLSEGLAVGHSLTGLLWLWLTWAEGVDAGGRAVSRRRGPECLAEELGTLSSGQ